MTERDRESGDNDFSGTNPDLHLVHEEIYRNLVENLNDAVYSIDSKGIVTYVSPIILKLTGYDPETMTGRSYLEFVAEEDRQNIVQRFKEIHEGAVMILEWRMRKEDGAIGWVLTSSVPIFRNGIFFGIQGTITDISERKKAEIALQEASRKLHLLNSVTRHDIRNKLLALTVYLSELQESLEDPKLLEYVGKSITSVKAVASQVEFTKEYQTLGEEASRWLKIASFLPETTCPRIDITREIADIEIFADPMLRIVFQNLCDNAVRHGVHVKEVRVYSHITLEGLVLTWEDNGVGIPIPEKERIFERGYGKNTGFGLFLVREILGITGITIRETGEPGTGARFEICVPPGSFRMPD